MPRCACSTTPTGGRGRPTRVHGEFLAGAVGELAGVTGNTIGQWARWGYIRASQSDGHPHVYSVEDVAEAAMVHALLERGISHMQVRRAIAALRDYGDWPFSEASPAGAGEGPGPPDGRGA